jgi:hypothetical protein
MTVITQKFGLNFGDTSMFEKLKFIIGNRNFWIWAVLPAVVFISLGVALHVWFWAGENPTTAAHAYQHIKSYNPFYADARVALEYDDGETIELTYESIRNIQEFKPAFDALMDEVFYAVKLGSIIAVTTLVLFRYFEQIIFTIWCVLACIYQMFVFIRFIYRSVKKPIVTHLANKRHEEALASHPTKQTELDFGDPSSDAETPEDEAQPDGEEQKETETPENSKPVEDNQVPPESDDDVETPEDEAQPDGEAQTETGTPENSKPDNDNQVPLESDDDDDDFQSLIDKYMP